MYKIITKRTIGTIMLVAVLCAVLVIEFLICYSQHSYVKSEKDVADFLSALSIDVADKKPEISEIFIPEKFDAVYSEYNDIQKQAGYNIEDYKGKKVTKYTYTVSNFDSDETVIVNVLVYKKSIIGGDISSTELDGFVLPLDIERLKLKEK